MNQENILCIKSIEPLNYFSIEATNLNVQYCQLFDEKMADFIYEKLENEIEYDKESKIIVFDKEYDIPRKQVQRKLKKIYI